MDRAKDNTRVKIRLSFTGWRDPSTGRMKMDAGLAVDTGRITEKVSSASCGGNSLTRKSGKVESMDGYI